MNESNSSAGLLRIKQILKLIPISSASWWNGVKSGRFPKPIKLGPNTTVWRSEDVQEIVDNPTKFFGNSARGQNDE